MFCNKCGKEVEINARFCPFCGDAVETKKVGFNARSIIGSMKSAFSQTADTISEKLSEAASPIELDIPEGGCSGTRRI